MTVHERLRRRNFATISSRRAWSDVVRSLAIRFTLRVGHSPHCLGAPMIEVP